MTYTLFLSPGPGIHHEGPMAPDEPYWFEVRGMQFGLEADAVRTGGTWRVGIVQHGTFTKWPDCFSDPESALATLQARYGNQQRST